MKPNFQSMECAGSLTPELEGSARSACHTQRSKPVKAPPQPKKGGGKYE